MMKKKMKTKKSLKNKNPFKKNKLKKEETLVPRKKSKLNPPHKMGNHAITVENLDTSVENVLNLEKLKQEPLVITVIKLVTCLKSVLNLKKDKIALIVENLVT